MVLDEPFIHKAAANTNAINAIKAIIRIEKIQECN